MRHLLLFALALLGVSACTCEPSVDATKRFACTTDADCADGFTCVDTGGRRECVASGTGGGSATGGGAGGGAGGGGGGGGGGGTGGGGTTPDHLAFTTPPRTTYPATCSPAVTLETRDLNDAPAAVATDTVLGLTADSANLRFFGAADCTGAVLTSVTVPGGTSSATVYFSATTVGAYVITAAAQGFTSATQPQTIVTAPTGLAFTTTPPSPLLAGMCNATTVEARSGTTPVTLVADAIVGLSTSVADGTRFYADMACAQTVTQTTISAGQASSTFYVKPLTGTTQTLTATASFATATQSQSPRPVVRRASCSFAGPVSLSDGGTTEEYADNCAVSPAVGDLAHAFVVVQVTGSSSHTNLEVRCRLTSTSNLRCERSNGTSSASYQFQVAELPRNARVVTFPRGGCTTAPEDLAITPPVDPARSFVLKATRSGGSIMDDDDMAIASLEDGGAVLRLNPGTCDGYDGADVQVVEWSALSVTRGDLDGGIDAGSRVTDVTGLSPVGPNTVLLSQSHNAYRANFGDPDPYSLCNLLVRGAMPTPSSVQFSRGAGVDAGCDVDPIHRIYFERIDFGTAARVTAYTASLAAGSGTQDVTITPVDVTRTVVLTSSQIVGGQGNGESAFNSAGAYNIGEASFRTDLQASNRVQVRRDRSSAAAVVTFYVIELDP